MCLLESEDLLELVSYAYVVLNLNTSHGYISSAEFNTGERMFYVGGR